MIDVIIVDDEKLIRQGIASGVNWQGLKCRVVALAENGREGLTLIGEKKPGLVITDIRMPRLNGLDMIRQARVFSPRTDYIVLSGFDEFEYARRAVSYGVLEYLLKPVDEEELEERVRSYVLGKCREIPTCGNPLIDRILEYTEYNLQNRRLSLNWLCENLVFKNSDYMGRLFKKHMGLSYHSYLNRKRIDLACSLLKEKGSKKIYEISVECGFPPDGQYFSTQFKSITGMTARQYWNSYASEQVSL